ncbi:hypothetical protein SARC_14923, partial [Sphaeroforma arctica JP610]
MTTNILKICLFTVMCLVALVQAGTTAEGLAYLEENAKKEGVITL